MNYELGLRYWYGWGSTAKNLYDTSGSMLVSRLTYDEFQSHSGELFGRVDHSSGWFVKANLGAGAIVQGRLKDEDFPPVLDPYSSTLSDQRDGSIAYGSADVGYHLVRGGDFRLGVFAGYHFLAETVRAYGCTQVAANPFVCAGGIANDVLVIKQDNRWHSVRLGLGGELDLFGGLKLQVEGAWLPYVWLDGADTHELRIGMPGGFTGPIPEDGTGHGFQLEAVLSSQLGKWGRIGVGGRWWKMQTEGATHFEGHVVGGGGSPQKLRWDVDHFGVFVQASIPLGPYAVGTGR
jgi:hypothetical protein